MQDPINFLFTQINLKLRIQIKSNGDISSLKLTNIYAITIYYTNKDI